MTDPTTDMPQINPNDAAAALIPGHVVLLDVREPQEWASGHAPEAVHVPLDSVPDKVDLAADVKIIAICRSGRRSAEAVGRLRSLGFDAQNLEGGMQAWAEAGLPVLRDDGSAGTVA